MRLYKSNLAQLAEDTNGFNQTPVNITFPQLPQDNRTRLVPKEVEEEKQLMFKEGDKMRIPGVLDYTGAKYPFKKKLVRKAQEGDYLPTVDLNAEIPDYILNDPYYSTIAPNKESLIYDDDVNYYYQNIVPEKIKKVKGQNYNSDYIKDIPFNYTGFFPDNNNFLTETFYQPGSSTMGVTLPDLMTNEISVSFNPMLRGLPLSTFLSHEYAHVMQYLKNLQQNKNIENNTMGYTPEEIQILKDAYDLSDYKVNVSADPNNKFYTELTDSQQLAEIGAMNTQAYFDMMQIFKSKFNKYPSISELNSFIDNMSKEELLDILCNGSNYGKHMFGRMQERKEGNLIIVEPMNISDDQIKRIKRALKEVAYNDSVQDSPLYAKTGIKIKKKNRGKFTEYCGGNVTQECINRAKNSGNKRLIKRAVFAENARKWKK